MSSQQCRGEQNTSLEDFKVPREESESGWARSNFKIQNSKYYQFTCKWKYWPTIGWMKCSTGRPLVLSVVCGHVVQYDAFNRPCALRHWAVLSRSDSLVIQYQVVSWMNWSSILDFENF